jgi:hypothetical protein
VYHLRVVFAETVMATFDMIDSNNSRLVYP